MSDRTWRLLLIAGVAIRIVLALVASNSNDLAYYVLAADDGAQRTPMYENSSFSYPPLWGYFFALAGRALVALHVPLIVHEHGLDAFVVPRLNGADLATPATALVLKFPAFVVDAALTELLYRCGLAAYGRDAARRLALAWWLNPLPLVVSGVQASWDSVVPFAMIYAIVCARQRRFALGGAALAAGILAKLTPLYVIFLVPALLRDAGAAKARISSLAAGIAGAAVVTAVVLWPILHWNEIDALRSAIFTRNGTFVVGGANVFAFAGLATAQPFDDWATLHRGALTLALSVASLAGSCAIGALCYRRAPLSLADTFVAAIALLAILFITTPFVQPTYMIWLIPFGLYLAAGGDRTWRAISWTLVTLALLFYLSVRAVQTLLEPACVFFKLCDVAHFGAASLQYANALGIGGSSLQVSIDVVLGECICVTLLFACAYAFDLLTRPAAAERATAVATTTYPGLKRQAIAAAAVMLVACGSAIAPGPAAIRVGVDVEGRRAVVTAHGYDGDLHVVVGDAASACAEIDVYGDDRYPSLRGVTPTFNAGLPIHLRTDLRARDVDLDVRSVDADGLARLLRARPEGRCLLVLGGALPATVRDRHRDLLEPWVTSGGVVFWAGGPFDVVVARRRDTDAAPLGVVAGDWPGLTGDRGTTVFPEAANVFAPPVEHASRPAPAWAATRIGFDRTTFPLNTGPLARAGGEPLAFLDGRYNSSVSSLPLGRGRLVFFGDAFDDELTAADTIAQLLYTGTWADPRHTRVVSGVASDLAPITVPNLRGGDSVRVFGDRYGGGPFAMADVPGRIGLSFRSNAAVLASERYTGGVYADVRPRETTPIARLVVYRDDRYPAGRGASLGFAQAVVRALRGDEEFGARRLVVGETDANGLRDELQRTPDREAIVVFGGVLPDTVRGRGFDLLKTWIARGGVVIWAGGPFDVLYAKPNPAYFIDAGLASPDYAPWPNLYGRGEIFPARVDPYYPPRSTGDRPAPAREIWRSDFRGTTFALATAALEKIGGTPLGFIDARGNSSVSTLPIGRGRVVFFGDSFANALDAADNIARLTLTGAWSGDWRSVRVQHGRLSPGAPTVTIPNVPAGAEVVVFGDAHDDVAPFVRNAPAK